MASKLPKTFPFRDIASQFAEEYAQCASYWYVPKARVLSQENVQFIKDVLQLIFDHFLGRKWNTNLQTELHARLVEERAVEPYSLPDEQSIPDQNALVRITKKLVAFLGLLWVDEDKEIIITDAGLDVLAADNPQPVIERQIAKYQYPNPGEVVKYISEFEGLLPHIFLLDVLVHVDLALTRTEYELFVNLAQSHEALERIVRYIQVWRDLSENEQHKILKLVQPIAMARPTDQQGVLVRVQSGSTETRFSRIAKNAPYQIRFHTYPRYLQYDKDDASITSGAGTEVKMAVDEWKQHLKVADFRNIQDWYSYYGDPKQKPSWAGFLTYEIEATKTGEEAQAIAKEYEDEIQKLSANEKEAVERQRREKWIEDSYVKALNEIEQGLRLYEDSEQNGQQFSTAIGRIDLLCANHLTGEYVVVEIKADEPDDATFGQILRYIGWVHRNLPNGEDNVRGVILARDFPEKSRYSRIGLLRADSSKFLKFRKHGLALESI